jgi:hypothetical protein
MLRGVRGVFENNINTMSKIIRDSDIRKCQTIRGGYTRRTIFALTGEVKPKSGWAYRLLGTMIPDDHWQAALNGAVRKKNEPVSPTDEVVKKLKSRIKKQQHQIESITARLDEIENLLDIR